LPRREIEMPLHQIHFSQQPIGGRYRGVQRQGLLRQCFGPPEIVPDKFCPTR
jgi:hypothetical protein